MKVTQLELNEAYEKVKEYKKEILYAGELRDCMIKEIYVDRNPLTDEYFDDKSEFLTPFKLTFMYDSQLGKNGAFYLLTEIELIEEDGD